MKYFLLLFCTIYFNETKAQDSINCSCYRKFRLNYPKKAQDNNICGEVIIEFDRDSFCILSHPVVKKGLGYGCDEEALKLATGQMELSNCVVLKCRLNKNCQPGKVMQVVTFECQKDD